MNPEADQSSDQIAKSLDSTTADNADVNAQVDTEADPSRTTQNESELEENQSPQDNALLSDESITTLVEVDEVPDEQMEDEDVATSGE